MVSLSILGILAAMVIPSTIAHHEKVSNMVKLKKVYSYITNTLEETLILNNCQTIGCVLSQHNAYYVQKSNTFHMDALTALFPEITRDTSHRCVPSKSRTLQGTTVRVGQHNDRNSIPGIDGRAKGDFCMNGKSNIGFTIWDYSFTSNHYGGSCDDPERRCGTIIVSLNGGRKTSKFGYDSFELEIAGNGTIMRTAPGGCDENGSSKTNGLGCLQRVMRNNWVIDY